MTGIQGQPGSAGVRGPSGNRGERGLSGEEQIDQLKLELQELRKCTTCQESAAGHLYGDGTQGTFTNGTLVTYWDTSSAILTGGMTYSNGYITVPTDGVYYVYIQAEYGLPTTGLYIYLNDDVITGQVNSHGGYIRTLRQGDRLFVQLFQTGRYSFSQTTMFGCFLV